MKNKNNQVLIHRPSEFIHQVTFQSSTETPNPTTGARSKTWANVLGLVDKLAKMRFVTGREVLSAGEVKAMHDVEVTIYRPDVMPDEAMRLVFDGTNYEIKSILPDDTNKLYLEIRCRKER